MSADPKAVLKAVNIYEGGLRAAAEAIDAYRDAVREEQKAEREAKAAEEGEGPKDSGHE